MFRLNQSELVSRFCSVEGISGIIGIVYLVILSILDIRARKLPVWLLALGTGMALAARIICGDIPAAVSAAGAAVGLFFLGVGRMTREAFGYGDGLLIFALGLYLGVWNLLGVLVLAFGLSAGVSILALVFRKFHRKAAMPFIPFLSVGYMFLLFTGGFG